MQYNNTSKISKFFNFYLHLHQLHVDNLKSYIKDTYFIFWKHN